MHTQSDRISQQSMTLPKTLAQAAGCWGLEPGQALSLRPGEAGVVRIGRGRIWGTLDGPHQGPGNDRGDMVLEAGDALLLRPGRRLVLEDWGGAGSAFSWDPVPAAPAVAQATRWRTALVRPAHELGVAVGRVLVAFGKLLAGLAGYSEFVVAGRGRVMRCMESNQP